MKRVLTALLVMGILSACSAQTPKPLSPGEFLKQMQESHVDGHVPAKRDFINFLERDLHKHFAEEFGADCVVDYQFLRNGPTQSGVSLPKYYLWLAIRDRAKGKTTEGAARIAAVEKKGFEVLQFFSKPSIQANPDNTQRTFPRALVPMIHKLAGVEG